MSQKAPVDPEVTKALHELGAISREAKRAAEAAPVALDILVDAVWQNRSSQSFQIGMILASLYNGRTTPRIMLDESICGLDWRLREAVCKILLGFNCGNFGGKSIGEAFKKAGGQEAFDYFIQSFVEGNVSQSLANLAEFCINNPNDFTAQRFRAILLSLFNNKIAVDLKFLDDLHQYYPEIESYLKESLTNVIEASVGRRRGRVKWEHVSSAFRQHPGGAKWLNAGTREN